MVGTMGNALGVLVDARCTSATSNEPLDLPRRDLRRIVLVLGSPLFRILFGFGHYPDQIANLSFPRVGNVPHRRRLVSIRFPRAVLDRLEPQTRSQYGMELAHSSIGGMVLHREPAVHHRLGHPDQENAIRGHPLQGGPNEPDPPDCASSSLGLVVVPGEQPDPFHDCSSAFFFLGLVDQRGYERTTQSMGMVEWISVGHHSVFDLGGCFGNSWSITCGKSKE